jgi:2-desacetyl-2-hydroxyethyl bacteriochlorophyllide A dehydrogenase
MKAAHYINVGKFEIRDTSPLPPAADEVTIRVAYCGICGTDLHIFHGKMDARVKPPQVIGHEMSGTLVAVGSQAKGWKVGDRVTVRPLDWCSECAACKAGHSHVCMKLKFMGIDSIGSFQEHWNVKARTLYRVPEQVSLKHAALIEPLAVACHDVRRAQLRAGEFAVVLGGGPIGLLIAMVAKAAGARVLVSEINPFRIAFARQAGFEVVNPAEQDLVAAVNVATGGAGADVVFEVTAAAAAAKVMTELPRVRGRIVVVGIYTQPPALDLFKFFWRELELCGARLYESEDFDRALAVAATGGLPLDSLITGVFPLAEIQAGFASLEGDATAIKTLIQCTEE